MRGDGEEDAEGEVLMDVDLSDVEDRQVVLRKHDGDSCGDTGTIGAIEDRQ